MDKINLTKKLHFLIVLIIVIFIVSCKPIAEDKKEKFEASQELKKFNSAQEIREFLQKNTLASQSAGIYSRFGGREISMAVAESVAAPQAKAADVGTATQAGEYSKTNIQVGGVDEADFVKNDGKYIYTITQDKLVIVGAFPAENAKILSETKLDGRPRNMFVNKDRLVIFSDDNEEVSYISEYDFVPRPRYTSKTHIFVYDISDRENPELLKDYNMNGYYFESRMIDNYVYFIVKEDVYYNGPIVILPAIKQASRTIVKPDIYYFDNPEQNYVYHTVASFDIFEEQDKINAKTFMMGYSNTLYVSLSNIYIAYQKNLPYTYYEKHNEERFYNVVMPLLPSDVRSNINEIKDDNSLDSHEKWDKISSILEDMYNNMEDEERNELIQEIEESIAEYEAKLEMERRKTVIHKINIDKGEIEYGTKGEVNGYLLNQFSLDEYNNNLRVATTTEFYGISPIVETTAKTSVEKTSIAKPISRPIRESKYIMYNNVYVLDENMKVIGKLEAIAPDERIYSTRFIGDRLYMVTFKRVDPLFVIDLSEPSNPKILGELKIPGFSDYLHPYDENHIIGVGKETDSNEWGGLSVKGVKLALFDVSDVENPKQLDSYEIGESGTDSEALRDHKAFLFDKKKNLLVIPVREIKGKQYYDSKLGYYRQRLWQGAYVFSLTIDDGFKVKGKITHNEGDEQSNYYYGSPNAVRRSLYMDDVLYTVSAAKIKANELDNIDNEIKEIGLPYEKVKYYDYPIY